MAAAEHAGSGSQTGSEYIIHHLQPLQAEVGSSTINVDSLFFSITLGLLFVIAFYLAARKATAGVPGRFQLFVEVLVEFVDSQVRDTFQGTSKRSRRSRSPSSAGSFDDSQDVVPVDLFPTIAHCSASSP